MTSLAKAEHATEPEPIVAPERPLYFDSLDLSTYPRSQEIGYVAAFLGVAALLVPSARWRCLTAVLMLDVEPEAPTITVTGLPRPVNR